jgi:hypothetical protein
VDVEPIYLSKSDFLNGKKCPKRLWLDKWRPDLGAKPSQGDLDRMQTGLLIGELARSLYPSGQVARRGESCEESSDFTRQLIADGAECIFEATFIDGTRRIRADVLRRLSQDSWAIDEVKSSTAKEPKLLKKSSVADVEFQSQVLERCGVRVTEKSLVLINSKYVYPGGEYDLRSLFSRVRIDDECEKIRLAVEVDASELAAVIRKDVGPEVETNTHCEGCPYFEHCHRDQPKHCLTFLPGIRASKVVEMRKLGYATIDLIPRDYALVDRMGLARDVVVSGRPFISPGLAMELQAIRYPAAYVDFESYMPALPSLPQTRPYQQICFQWSAHILESKQSDPVHCEFLFDGPADPREDFCRTLYDAVRDCKSVLYYATFEKLRLREMSDANIPYASQLVKLFDERGIDLHAIVREHIYLEEFKGRTSIKTVLPALVPDLSYEGMAIADGNSASAAFQEMISENCTPARRRELRDSLLAYCKMDTLAMVRVQDRLSKFTISPLQAPAPPKGWTVRPLQLEFAF